MVRAQETPPPLPAPETVETISTGETVSLNAHLQPNSPTVFVFFNATSSADRKLVADLSARRGASDRVGLCLIRLPSLDAPAAKQHDIRETPTVLILDRFGKTITRTSTMEEIDRAVMTGLRMARLQWVDEKAANAPSVYQNLGAGQRPVPEILKTMSLQPEWMNAIMELSSLAHFRDTHLTRLTKEMIATYVSGINRCKY